MAGGTGQKLTYATTVVAGVASLSATLFSIVYAALPSRLSLLHDSPILELTSKTDQHGSKRMPLNAQSVLSGLVLTWPQQELQETAAAAIRRSHLANVSPARRCRILSYAHLD